MMQPPTQDSHQLADELVDWTRKWMAALPRKVCRALRPEEVGLLKDIFVQKLEGKEVELGEPELLGSMYGIVRLD